MYQNKIERISCAEYAKLIGKFKFRNVFVSPDYISSLEKIKNIEIYSIVGKNGPIALFPANVIKRGFFKIFLNPPFTPYFNILFNNPPEGEREKFRFYESAVGDYIRFLKSRFSYFSASQSPEFDDSRHYAWSGAKVSLKYTYILEYGDKTLDSVDRMIRNKELKKYTENCDFEANYNMLKNAYNNNPPASKKEYKVFMESLKKNDMLKCFSNDSASVVFLLDKENKTAYTYNICGKDTALLIYSVLKSGALGEYAIDFHGANTKRISMYKSMFNPKIKSYFNISGFYDFIH
ncbi:TPA: hypothetical protein DCW38_07055 [candidate division WOR-3 bacterium]|jgi:hypothetical protein|uniref:GNAT family N-acetyltransferase n=1 Tax=candidate division WOR-3 bacterium TaxID=2052148 RepID=A0A350HBK2_UNCW3|nr:hypothetical protein [candidate division WOR-3 bacterium]